MQEKGGDKRVLRSALSLAQATSVSTPLVNITPAVTVENHLLEPVDTHWYTPANSFQPRLTLLFPNFSYISLLTYRK